MTDKIAKRVRQLITSKENLLNNMDLLIAKGQPSKDVRMELNFRIDRGMYTGYPFHINLKNLEMNEIEVVTFITQKIRDKIKEIDYELSNY